MCFDEFTTCYKSEKNLTRENRIAGSFSSPDFNRIIRLLVELIQLVQDEMHWRFMVVNTAL